MSNNQIPAPPVTPLLPPPPNNKRHKWALWGFLSFIVLCGLLWVIYWVIWGQFSESTDDAYVTGNLIVLTPQEAGIVTTILVDNAQLVEAGQPVLELDRHDYEIAFAGAKADLAEQVREVTQMFFKVGELKAKKEVTEADLIRASLDYKHRLMLVSDGSIAREDFEHSETTLLAAFASMHEVEKELAAAIAQVENTTVATHPLVEQAKSSLRKAFLSLHRCTVLAPTRGIITQRQAQVGEWVEASDSLMSLVPVEQIWVDANFREVDLKNIRIGQPVEMFADMYGRGTKFHGRIIGMNPGTGSVFSILPPQNATGNWIKIVQRIPVKISLELAELHEYPLVLGLSMTVYVDTHRRIGQRLALPAPVEPVYGTQVYVDELKGIDEMIEQIIADNSTYNNGPSELTEASQETKDLSKRLADFHL